MDFILLILLVFIIIGVLPTWPYSKKWSYYPSGIIALIALIILVLLVSGLI